jgi:hypothetical protein
MLETARLRFRFVKRLALRGESAERFWYER